MASGLPLGIGNLGERGLVLSGQHIVDRAIGQPR